jgi:DNA helicase-2/ATP-dependent DNA helicase PcrA
MTRPPILDTLNPEQHAAATYAGNENILLAAGAGSGKTRTLVARTAHLVAAGTDPERILAVAFTRKAAAQITERLQNEIGPDDAALVRTGTCHSFALNSIRRNPRLFGDFAKRRVMDADDAEQLFRVARNHAVEALGIPKKEAKDTPKPSQIAAAHSYARNCRMELGEYLARHARVRTETADFIKRASQIYDELKTESNLIDFDDILEVFGNALENSEAGPFFRKMFDHLLVDEFQDTNPLQFRIFSSLIGPARLFACGDPAQSIYGFRGADFELSHKFTERVPESIVLHLNRNYRSTQEILDLPNWLIEASPLEYDRKLLAEKGSAGPAAKPVRIHFRSPDEEARTIAEDIVKRPLEFNETFVLVRSAFDARPMEAAFVAKRIPYRLCGGTAMMQTAHAKDVLAAIRAAIDSADMISWTRFLRLWPGMGEKTAAKIHAIVAADGTSEESLLYAIPEKNANRSAIILTITRILEATTPAGAAQAAVDSLWAVLSENYGDWKRRSRDLENLVSIAENHASLDEFLDNVALDPRNAEEEIDPNESGRVTISTVHAAKGLEADTVFVAQCSPGHFPHVRAVRDARNGAVEEERRLLYVAMTRARKRLAITSSDPGPLPYPVMFDEEQQTAESLFFMNDTPEALFAKTNKTRQR